MSRRLLIAALGGVLFLLADLVLPQPGTFMILVPVLWGWGVISAIAGADVANQQPWLSVAVATVIHSAVFSAIVWLFELVTRRFLGARGSSKISIAIVGLIYLAVMMTMCTLTDGP